MLERTWWMGALVVMAACGGKAIIDPGPGGDGGAGGTGPTVTTSTSDSSVTVATSTSGGGGELPFRIEIGSALGSANCQPAVPPDPMDVTIVLDVDNTTNPSALMFVVTGATIDSPMGTTDFDVVPVMGTFVAAGVETSLAFVKVPNSASGINGCAYCGETAASLTLEISAAGEMIEVEGPVDSFSCAF